MNFKMLILIRLTVTSVTTSDGLFTLGVTVFAAVLNSSGD